MGQSSPAIYERTDPHVLKDEFASNILWTQIDTSLGHLLEVQKTATPDSMTLINRIRFIANYAKSFDVVPSEYFTTGMLSKVSNFWINVQAYLEQYLGNPNPSSIASAFAQAESALEQIAQWPSPLTKGESLAQVTKTFRAYGAELEEARNRAQEKHLNYAQSLTTLEARALEIETTLNVALEKGTSQLALIEAKINAAEQRMEQSLTKNNDTFEASEKSRDLSLREWLLTQEASFSELAKPSLDEIHKLLVNANESFNAIDQLRTDTEKVAGLATGDILANKYAASASQERKTGLRAYAGGWGALALGLLVYLATFGGVTIDRLSWEAITLKFGFSAAIVGGATIAFRLGGRSLKLSSTYKRMELELRAIGPFLADVADPDQTKKDFIDRAFGRSWDGEPTGKSMENLEQNLFNRLVPAVLTAFGVGKK